MHRYAVSLIVSIAACAAPLTAVAQRPAGPPPLIKQDSRTKVSAHVM